MQTRGSGLDSLHKRLQNEKSRKTILLLDTRIVRRVLFRKINFTKPNKQRYKIGGWRMSTPQVVTCTIRFLVYFFMR